MYKIGANLLHYDKEIQLCIITVFDSSALFYFSVAFVECAQAKASNGSRVLSAVSYKRQIKVEGISETNVFMEVDDLYFGVTHLQRAGCVGSCPTSSAVGK